jgi:FtsP/CotA-like multicopper oxidase with cupredoxin domain
MNVAPARYRFRLVNASNARRYVLRLNPGGDLVQIGGDAGLLTSPVHHASLPVSPGERYDVVVDFAAYPRGATVLLTDAAAGDLLRWRVTGPAAADPSRVPERLGGGTPPDELTSDRQVLRFARHNGRWTVNGRPFDPSRPDIGARLGRTQLWTVTADVSHPFHVHGTAFRVVHRVGGLRATDSGWKDTVEIGAAQAVTMAVRFRAGPGRYLAHCHNLEHEDMSMMANVEVT